MAQSIERPAKDFPEICAAVGYRKRKVFVIPTTTHTFQGLNWDGGTRSRYWILDLVSGDLRQQVRDNTMIHPAEGKKVEIVPNTVIVEYGIFMGKPSQMRLYVHPDNMPALLEG